ncbi:MAG: hypothetical protein ACK5O2_16750 [Microthrixaceae bacterium]
MTGRVLWLIATRVDRRGRRLIRDTEGVAPDRQQLFFNDVDLEDGRSLSDYYILAAPR